MNVMEYYFHTGANTDTLPQNCKMPHALYAQSSGQDGKSSIFMYEDLC